MSVSPEDLSIAEAQLGRPLRNAHEVSSRCPCGGPAVVTTPPKLEDGTPFPTFYYATCPRLTGAISTLETTGLMAEMSQRLQDDPVLAAKYQAAHEAFLAARNQLGAELNLHAPEIEGISAGGMPTRVKCLHSLVAHSLSAGPGVNPLGDEALAALPKWWLDQPCCEVSA